MPDFDSYKSSTISAESEHLLRRLVLLVPEDCQPESRSTDSIDSYLNELSTLEELDELSTPPSRYSRSFAWFVL